MLCLILTSGHFFDACQNNFKQYVRPIVEEERRRQQERESQEGAVIEPKKKSGNNKLIKSIAKFDYKGFVNK